MKTPKIRRHPYTRLTSPPPPPPEQIICDEFINVLTCFKCYKYDDQPTKYCEGITLKCSECSQSGHKWMDCKSPTKKCTNCG